jgi:hypothetical protein
VFKQSVGNLGHVPKEMLLAVAAINRAAANQKSGGGGGGPSLYDQLAIIGAQQGQQVKPNYGNAAVSGIAQGIGAGITAGLTR